MNSDNEICEAISSNSVSEESVQVIGKSSENLIAAEVSGVKEMYSGLNIDFDIAQAWSQYEVDRMGNETCEDIILVDGSQWISNEAFFSCSFQRSTLFHQDAGTSSYVGASEEEYTAPYLHLMDWQYLPEIVMPYWPHSLLSEPQKGPPITLVLDLDETLVHSSFDVCEDADFSFSIHSKMKVQTVFVRQRPYLQMFLEAVSSMFDVVIFTAGESIYAEQLLDILDPHGTLIGERVYRDSCFLDNDGGYLKDLTILGRDLARIAIVDNTPQVFQLQVENGIPIESWFGDPSDGALLSLLLFLETLVGAEDVRPIIQKKFGNQK